MSTHTAQHFEIHKGDSILLTITVEDSTGNAVNITNATEIKFRVAGDQLDATMDISKNMTDDSAGDVQISDGSAGEFTVQLNPVDTASLNHGMYHWEAELEDNSNNISTVVTGYLSLLPSLT